MEDYIVTLSVGNEELSRKIGEAKETLDRLQHLTWDISRMLNGFRIVKDDHAAAAADSMVKEAHHG